MSQDGRWNRDRRRSGRFSGENRFVSVAPFPSRRRWGGSTAFADDGKKAVHARRPRPVVSLPPPADDRNGEKHAGSGAAVDRGCKEAMDDTEKAIGLISRLCVNAGL